MAQKKAIIGTIAFFLVSLLTVGYFAMAAEMGGKDDPLVTLGYLKGLEPELKSKISVLVEDEIKTKKADLDKEYETARKSLQELAGQLSGGGGVNLAEDDEFISKVADAVVAKMGGQSTGDAPSGVLPDTFKKITVGKGKTVTVEMGGMFFIRLNSATCYAASGKPGLIDLTDGKELDGGAALVTNHLYTVTVDSSARGFKAGGADVTAFILGSYKIT